jgi:hypothetical protein
LLVDTVRSAVTASAADVRQEKPLVTKPKAGPPR